MKTDGIVRKLDPLGRLVIPKEIRKKHDMHAGDEISIINNRSYIVIKKYSEGCIFCGNSEEITEYKNICVCNKCRQSLNNQFI